MFGKSISCSAIILAVVVFFGKMIIGIFVDPAETEVVKMPTHICSFAV